LLLQHLQGGRVNGRRGRGRRDHVRPGLSVGRTAFYRRYLLAPWPLEVAVCGPPRSRLNTTY
jgi:hypothetical protein